MTIITRKLVQTAAGLSWQQVVNIFADEDQPRKLHGIADGNPLALRASNGNGNEFIISPGRSIENIEAIDTIWSVLQEGDVHHITRRTREGEFLEATYEEVPGTWLVTLESPVDNDGFSVPGPFLRAFKEELVDETPLDSRSERGPRRRDLFKVM